MGSTRKNSPGRQDGEARAGQGHRPPRAGRRAGCHAAGSAGQVDQGSTQCHCGDHRARRRLQEPQGQLGGHYKPARPANADGARRLCRVRARIDSRAHREGRKRAKERGVRFGRPRKLTPHQRQEALQRLANGETQPDVARTYNVDATTIGRILGDRRWSAPTEVVRLEVCL